MKVVLLSEMFAKNMGYLENMLPKYLSQLGAEVHVVSTGLPPYYWIDNFEQTYGKFCSQIASGSVESIQGYTLHVLKHESIAGYVRMAGLRNKLCSLRPDVVQTMAVIGLTPLEAAAYRPFLRYRLFTGCHTTASVFPLASRRLPWWNTQRLRCTLMRTVPGYFVSLFSEKCYGATCDCADVAVRFFGVPAKKADICPLGVDTEIFRPCTTRGDIEARHQLRQELGFDDSDIVCVYTGRFTDDKNPLLLARAIERLTNRGLPYRGLFVGDGPQATRIQMCQGCITHSFVPVSELGYYFRASEIGVWPTQESMSMLDAAGCGLPIIVNDTLMATERVEGNGIKYQLNNLEDLVRVLLELRDAASRRILGQFGARKVKEQFSWRSLAARRLADYEIALGKPGSIEKLHQEEPISENRNELMAGKL